MKWLGDSGTTLCKEEVKTDSSSSTLRPSLSASMSREDIPESVTSPETKMVRDLLNDVLEQVDDKIVEVRSEDSSVQGPVLQSRLRDVVVSSSSHSGLTSDGNHHPLSEEIEQLSHATETLDAHQMNSTPKLKPYEEAVNVHQVTAKGIDRDSEGRGYSEGISSDSGIDEHLSRETVHGDSSIADHHDPKLWLENFNTKQGQGKS